MDYANYIFAKHKTDSANSYSHYTRFYALIRRVCTSAKTWGFSSGKRNKDDLRKGNQPQSTGIEGGNGQNLHPSPKWREVSRQSRETAKGTKGPPQPRPSSAHTIRGRSRSRIWGLTFADTPQDERTPAARSAQRGFFHVRGRPRRLAPRSCGGRPRPRCTPS